MLPSDLNQQTKSGGASLAVPTLGGSGGGTLGLMMVLDLLKEEKREAFHS